MMEPCVPPSGNEIPPSLLKVESESDSPLNDDTQSLAEVQEDAVGPRGLTGFLEDPSYSPEYHAVASTVPRDARLSFDGTHDLGNVASYGQGSWVQGPSAPPSRAELSQPNVMALQCPAESGENFVAVAPFEGNGQAFRPPVADGLSMDHFGDMPSSWIPHYETSLQTLPHHETLLQTHPHHISPSYGHTC